MRHNNDPRYYGFQSPDITQEDADFILSMEKACRLTRTGAPLDRKTSPTTRNPGEIPRKEPM